MCCGLLVVDAQEIMRRADTDANAVIDLGEFVKYMHAHERKLHLAFTSLDRNHDGELVVMSECLVICHVVSF